MHDGPSRAHYSGRRDDVREPYGVDWCFAVRKLLAPRAMRWLSDLPVPIFRSAFRTKLGGVAASDNTYYTLVIRFVMRCFIRTSPLGTKVAMGSVSGFVRFTMPYGITP